MSLASGFVKIRVAMRENDRIFNDKKSLLVIIESCNDKILKMIKAKSSLAMIYK